MPQILIRRLDQHVVRKLRAKAAADSVSAEEEARRILRRSLVGEAPAVSLIDFIRTMPDVGDGRIFRRPKRKSPQSEIVNGFLLDTNVVSELREAANTPALRNGIVDLRLQSSSPIK